MGRKEKIGLFAAVIVIGASFILQPTVLMSRAGITTIALLIAFLILLIAEVFPIVLTCFVFLGLMPVLHVTESFSDALSGFSNQVVFFVLASFGIAAAFEKVPLSQRVLKALLKKFGRSTDSILFAMMAGAALISSVMSNVPCCAIFMAISLRMLGLYEDECQKRQSGRAFMIGIPVASMIGGMMTPAGSSINLLAIGLLEQFTGETITFVQWMIVGIPITIFALPVAWFIIVKVYRPAETDKKSIGKFISSIDISPAMNIKEKKTIAIMAAMLSLWILSSWVPSINVMVVALLGCALFCMPGINVLEIGPFLRETNWDAFFLLATVLSLGNAMVTNKVSDWIVSILPQMELSNIGLTAFTCVLIFLLLIVIPVAPSLVTIMASPLIALAAGANGSAPLIIISCALCACNCFLLPLDTVTMITYSKGYYSMMDMPKSTILIQIWTAILITVWAPIACGIVGLL